MWRPDYLSQISKYVLGRLHLQAEVHRARRFGTSSGYSLTPEEPAAAYEAGSRAVRCGVPSKEYGSWDPRGGFP